MRGYGTIWEAIKAVVAADYCDERGEGTIIELEDGSFTGHVTDEGTLSEHMTDEQREQGVELMLTPAGIVEAPPYFSVMQNAGTTWLTERGVAEGRDCKYLVPVALNIPGALASPAFSMPDGIELALTQDGNTAPELASSSRRGVWMHPASIPRAWYFYVTKTLTRELLGAKAGEW